MATTNKAADDLQLMAFRMLNLILL